jgi:hypothetical protein
MPINNKVKVPEIKDMTEDYRILAALVQDDEHIKKMWCLNELDRQSCEVDVASN